MQLCGFGNSGGSPVDSVFESLVSLSKLDTVVSVHVHTTRVGVLVGVTGRVLVRPCGRVQLIGASLSEPHIDRDNVPARGIMVCLYLSIYLSIYPSI